MKEYLLVASFVLASFAWAQEKNVIIMNGGEGEQQMQDMPDLPELAYMDEGDDMGDGFFNIEIEENDMVIMEGGPMDGGPMGGDLGITREQTEKIKKIRTDAKKKNIPLHGDIQLKKIDLRELMDSDSPDRDKIAAKIKEMDAIKTQIKLTRTMARLDVRSIFTKEQREKMEKMKMDRRVMMHGDHEGGPMKRKMKMKFMDREGRE